MGGSHDKRFPKSHETVLWYSKGDSKLRSNDPNVRVPFSDYVLDSMEKDENGKFYYERRRMSRKATAEEAASKAHTRTYVDTRADSYFDGTQGQRLAKVIPFGHPLSLTDLEDLKRELEARPNEERDVVVVCLGKELSVDGWLEDWNRLRKRGDVPNKIEVIELRTDPKYGKFMAHQPAQAKVNIARKGDKIAVEILDFISPTILERLQSQAGLLKPKIDDWRAMVDCVMVDPAYDGKVFNIALADVPEKKTDFVQGKYELPAPKGKTNVAVKITDMLGEEVLATKEV
jgi:hypothetical protein